MTKQQAKDLFNGSTRKLAEALGLSVQAVTKWPEHQIPKLREYQLKELKGIK